MAKFQGTSSKRTEGTAKKKSAIGDKIKMKNKKIAGKSHHRYYTIDSISKMYLTSSNNHTTLRSAFYVKYF